MTEYLNIDGEIYAEHEWECHYCLKTNLSRYPVGADVLECSHYRKISAPVEMVSAPLIVSIISVNDVFMIQVNRKARKSEAINHVLKALNWLSETGASYITPPEKPVAIITMIDPGRTFDDYREDDD